jgi:hypothetical protein
MSIKKKLVSIFLDRFVFFTRLFDIEILCLFILKIKELVETSKIDANEQMKLKLKSVMRMFYNSLAEDVRLILPK